MVKNKNLASIAVVTKIKNVFKRLQKKMYLSYDVVKIILEIKYQNWINEKKCLCGSNDFKRCSIFECKLCDNNYCRKQIGYSNWIWECRSCYDWYCGDHSFRLIIRNGEAAKVCDSCTFEKKYFIPKSKTIEKLSKQKLVALNRYYENYWKRLNH